VERQKLHNKYLKANNYLRLSVIYTLHNTAFGATFPLVSIKQAYEDTMHVKQKLMYMVLGGVLVLVGYILASLANDSVAQSGDRM